MAEMTTIPVTKHTRDLLKSLGRKGETYDQLLRRLVAKVGWDEFVQEQYSRLEERGKFVPLEEID